MGLELEYINGQTPLDEDEKEGLKIPTIITRNDLNEFEQLNIENAIKWTLARKIKLEVLLSEEFIKELHKRMLGDVWKWAGEFRKTNKNIGVDKYEIGIELKKLLEDCRYWIENNVFSEDEIAIRFSHRLVLIHCFPNGNGRHSRLVADLIVSNIFGKKVFTWGSSGLINKGEARSKYINALRLADNGDYEKLIEFSRE